MPDPLRISPRAPPLTPPSTVAAPSAFDLAKLAEMLKRTQGQRVAENAPSTPPVTVPQNLPNFSQMANPQAMGAPMAPPAIPPMGAALAQPPPMAPNPAPSLPPANQPSDMPAMPPPVNIGAAPQQALSTDIWGTLKRMFANGQVPEGYRGAMGEMLKNT